MQVWRNIKVIRHMDSSPAAALTKRGNPCASPEPQSCVAHSSGGLKSESTLVATVPLKPQTRSPPCFSELPAFAAVLGAAGLVDISCGCLLPGGLSSQGVLIFLQGRAVLQSDSVTHTYTFLVLFLRRKSEWPINIKDVQPHS